MTRDESGGLDFGVGWSVVFLPLLLVFAVLSYPYGWSLIAVDRYRERRLRARMKSAGRLLLWEEFIPKLESAQGTLIVESVLSGWPRAFGRLWWTPDAVYSGSPYRWVDAGTEPEMAEFDLACEWCRRRYASAAGTALLIETTDEQRRSFYARESTEPFRPIPRHAMNWVDLWEISYLPRRSRVDRRVGGERTKYRDPSLRSE